MKKLLAILNMKRAKLCFILLFTLSSSLITLKAQTPTLLGMTYQGGANGDGNIFEFSPNPASFTNLVSFTGQLGSYPGQSPYTNHVIKATDGNLYGMTAYGGADVMGNIFKYNPNTNAYTDLVDFSGTNGAYPGFYPYGSLVQASDSNLYGMTEEGGVNGIGNIFKYNIATGIFTDLIDLTGTTGSYLGENPWGNLVQAYDGNLYGMTSLGGTNGEGNIFKYNPTTGTFTDLVDFTNGTSNFGRNPRGSLVQATDSTLYGMTTEGGPSYIGSIFSYNIGTGTFTNLVFFTGATGAYPGYGPEGSLIQATDGNLYGMTSNGAANNYGNIFNYNPASGVFTDLIDFTDQTGSYPGGTPLGTLLQASDSNLYGTAEQGGANNDGVIFEYNITTGAYTDLVDFTGTTGSYLGDAPDGDLIELTTVTTGTKTIANKYRANLFPNPNTGQFTISVNGITEKSELDIYNVLGENIYTASIYAGNTSINLGTIPAGAYLYKIITPDGSLVKDGKIVIE